MGKAKWLGVLGLAALSASAAAYGQRGPYIGYIYPAGGQQGTTFQIRLGGQYLDGVDSVLVTGTGVQAKVVEYFGRLGNQEMTLLREQLSILRPRPSRPTGKKAPAPKPAPPLSKEARQIVERIDRRMAEYVNTPANAAISNLVFAEVTIAPDAAPGRRELRLRTTRGLTNPMVFDVGQVPEVARKPMKTSVIQVLGKEEQGLRKRPPEEEEVLISVPCTANGQIASGEVNRYRFEARKGQRLLICVAARQLIPYVADAVPGWFQPVVSVRDSHGGEVAYNDDYRFKPDPVVFFQVPADGQYVLSITDAIYRGREDFVYRLTIGELPFVTSIFPLGGQAGKPAKIEMTGWNLENAVLAPPPADAAPGIHWVAATREGIACNRLPFAVDTLPEGLDKEPNNDRAKAQKVKLPIIINGRIDRPDDWDVFQFTGQAGQTVVAEVWARRLDSPLDSVLRLTDAGGNVLAMNDDHEDPEAGVNTHDADSYLMVKLPADGTYYVHLGDTGRAGGPEYAYRLRLSPPRPDFTLFAVPSGVVLRSKSSARVDVRVLRKEGFAEPIKVSLKDPPKGFTMAPVTIPPTKATAQLYLKTTLAATPQPVDIHFEGRATVGKQEIARETIPAEDRMQAFLWRHLVPAEDLKALVYNASSASGPKRVPRPTTAKPAPAKPQPAAAGKPKFSKQQVAGRLRQLKNLFEQELLTDDFYNRNVAECEAAQ